MLKHALALFVLFGATLLYATPQYAQQTGQSCVTCHVDAAGGGTLRDVGKGYRLSLHKADASPVPYTKSYLTLFILYLHILTAVFWFGTILYVHIVLKPKYASKGLPPAEMKVGMVSMVIMALTGTYLTLTKVASFEIFYTSTFGMLLGAKILLFMVMVLSALYVILFIAPKLKGGGEKKALDTGYRDMTLGELAHFNGKEGAPAYIGYKGRIYDVSASKKWKNGEHMRKVKAGEDLTAMISQAPHGEEKILAMPEVGRLLEDTQKQTVAPQAKVFYLMSYLNLTIVFLILFIITLWRWN